MAGYLVKETMMLTKEQKAKIKRQFYEICGYVIVISVCMLFAMNSGACDKPTADVADSASVDMSSQPKNVHD